MKQYLLSVYQPDEGTPPPEVLAKIRGNLNVLHEELRAAGAWVSVAGLSPASTAKVVRVKIGETLITDGPYVESKEHIGGFLVIQAPDLESALVWARKSAEATTLPIEVRLFNDSPMSS